MTWRGRQRGCAGTSKVQAGSHSSAEEFRLYSDDDGAHGNDNYDAGKDAQGLAGRCLCECQRTMKHCGEPEYIRSCSA